MKITNVTIGADPELFIINEETKKVVSAIGLIPGEKGNPYKADDMPNGFGIETDNILSEFNIPPCTSEVSFINSIEYMKQYIDKFVKSKNPKLGIMCTASALVPTSQLKSPQAKEFGCDIDFNAYTEEANPKPKGNRTNIRSAGMHIHLGYDYNNIDTSLMLIKYLDMYLGIPSILKDSDKKRRSLYGKAGCFRLKPYGCEYRVLSSALMKDIDLIRFVWRQVSRAITAHNSGYPLANSSDIQTAINNSDVELASKIIKAYTICVD